MGAGDNIVSCDQAMDGLNLGSIPGGGKRIFLQTLWTGSGTHPISWSVGIRDSWGFKWLGHESDNEPPFSAKVKNVWSYTSALSVWLHVLHKDFTFYLFIGLFSADCEEMGTFLVVQLFINF